MGVIGLQYYIENKCPDACKSVSIQRMADEHRRRFNCEPVIVVDGMALINRLYAKNLEWIYGGQWLQFIKKLEEFISLFRSIGVRLVFFFDGTVCAAKRKEWVKRRVAKYQQIKSIFSNIHANHREPDQKHFQLPTSMGTLTRFALKELGAEVYQTDREADESIVEYANNNRDVFAILSQDSDFIIYNTKTYLSLLHLDLESLTTTHYDRDCFAFRYLHIDVNQLPLFACLAGNDIIPTYKLNYFHRYLSNNKIGRIFISDIAENLAAIINEEGWSADVNNKQELHSISKRICGSSSLMQLIRLGLSSYVIGYDNIPSNKINIYLQPSSEGEVLSKHLQCVNAPFVFNLLCNLEYESSEVLEDTSRLPSALVYRKIRQKCYGVLFNYYSSQGSADNTLTKDGKPILIREWCAYHGNSMEKPEYIQPLPINLPPRLRDHPFSVERLWFQYSEEEKMMVLHSILELSFQFDTFLNIPKHLIVLASVLNCLINGVNSDILLEPLDIAALIIQALSLKDMEELREIQAPWVDATAVNVSTLFMRGVTTILMAINVCGNPFPIALAMPWHFFDGKLFHHYRIKVKEQPYVNTICNQKKNIIKQFYWLLSVVTTNTPFNFHNFRWANVFKDFDVSYLY
ncbi:constitutive coactivator of peroxisome proliferator-activated receptor gamma [Parasteatoda tepidariorum]|uniref:constitutive coactivator of peroxisome proliferator-activated receptor gamma n=1 Tax=Parasteatoda tepidariorum TaxID=114398 RepID=UPI00077FB65E|nr:constitutive coactivator of peroxisome proliferator-activated receptor gamma [Parasteatoda tepidariorum]